MRPRLFGLFAVVLASVLAVDQLTKYLVRTLLSPPGTSLSLVGSLLRLTYVRNTGAAFGLLQGFAPFFVVVSVAVIAGIGVVLWRAHDLRPGQVIALALVAAGSVGNLIDRVVVGRVTDFIELPDFPVFNVADSAICVGVALLIWWTVFSSAAARHPAEGPTT